MTLGGVYVWDTDKAQGHELRRKFHIYICEGNWQAEGYAFSFISSSDYGGDYLLRAADYQFLKADSFASCGNLVFYSEAELQALNPPQVGQISKPHLAELFHRIAGSDFMVGWQIRMACEALKSAL